MFTDTHPNGELAHECVTAMCLAHARKVWTGGDAHEWRHSDNKPCAGQRTTQVWLSRVSSTHSSACKCWQCLGDPFAGIPQPDADPFAGAQIIGPAEVLAEYVSHYGTIPASHPAAVELVESGAANVVVVDPGMQGVLF